MVEKRSFKFSDSLSDLDSSHLMCRTKGHYWIHSTDKVLSQHRGEPKLISRDWNCGRCSTGMLEELHIPTFDLVSRKYYYTDGYLLSKRATDGERINIRDLREEQLVRAGLVKPDTKSRSKKVLRLRAVN